MKMFLACDVSTDRQAFVVCGQCFLQNLRVDLEF